MLKFIPHSVFEVPRSIPHWGTPMGYPSFSSDPKIYLKQVLKNFDNPSKSDIKIPT